jgi:dTDP-4-dehydrorhamnose reductase
MNILILGATGMLGHKLMQLLSRRFEVTGTVRGPATIYANHPVLGQMALLGDVQAENFDSVVRALASIRPNAVINCIGIIKQLPAAKAPLPSIAINALFPHRLAQLCQAAGIHLVHISTDCVFSGRKGMYTEDDLSDAEDLYGRTKFLGEVTGPRCLTLRTSIIGRELQTRSGLIEWFIGHRNGTVAGYAKAIYTGFTTKVLAELIGNVLERYPGLSGLWHVSSDPISKYELLGLVNQAFRLGITINRDETFICDRSLNSTRFRETTRYEPPAWQDMIAQIASDPTPYDKLKSR